MSLLNVPDYDCESESDVEQKLIYPMLVHPSFLGIPSKAILSKRSLVSMPFVNKTSLPKNYIPDYLISLFGLPVCVIEAKEPEVSVDNGVRSNQDHAKRLYSYQNRPPLY